MRHTPGPWSVGQQIGAGSLRIIAPKDTHGQFTVAETWDIPTPDGMEAEEANARLIAAAPELLEALERLTEKVARANDLQHSRKSRTIPTEDWSELYQLAAEARAAIAKAKGEEVTP